jgi:hypothetical protein
MTHSGHYEHAREVIVKNLCGLGYVQVAVWSIALAFALLVSLPVHSRRGGA